MLKKSITSILLATLFVGMTGCAGTIDQSATEGMAIGAIVGAIVGYAQDGEEGAKKGAIIGAAAGMIGGAAYGNHVANQRARFKSEEAYLNACTAQAQTVNSETRTYNTTLQGQIRSLSTEVNQMVRAYKQKELSRSQLVRKKQEIDAQLAWTRTKLDRVRDELVIQKTVYRRQKNQSQTRLAKLNNQIRELENNVATLEQETRNLKTISARLSA